MRKPKAKEPAITPRMEAVLARLCERLGYLTKTQAVKLPYLVDVLAKGTLGRAIAGGSYQCWQYGVVTREVYHGIADSKAFKVSEQPYSEDTRITLANSYEQLTAEEQEVVDAIADEFGKLDMEALGRLTKQMNTHIPRDKWGSNATADTGESAYFRISRSWQATCERIEKLDMTNLEQSSVEIKSAADLLRRVS
ncbi:MAG: Panacea domain-containing protein [Polyangia bacterium]